MHTSLPIASFIIWCISRHITSSHLYVYVAVGDENASVVHECVVVSVTLIYPRLEFYACLHVSAAAAAAAAVLTILTWRECCSSTFVPKHAFHAGHSTNKQTMPGAYQQKINTKRPPSREDSGRVQQCRWGGTVEGHATHTHRAPHHAAVRSGVRTRVCACIHRHTTPCTPNTLRTAHNLHHRLSRSTHSELHHAVTHHDLLPYFCFVLIRAFACSDVISSERTSAEKVGTNRLE